MVAWRVSYIHNRVDQWRNGQPMTSRAAIVGIGRCWHVSSTRSNVYAVLSVFGDRTGVASWLFAAFPQRGTRAAVRKRSAYAPDEFAVVCWSIATNRRASRLLPPLFSRVRPRTSPAKNASAIARRRHRALSRFRRPRYILASLPEAPRFIAISSSDICEFYLFLSLFSPVSDCWLFFQDSLSLFLINFGSVLLRLKKKRNLVYCKTLMCIYVYV